MKILCLSVAVVIFGFIWVNRESLRTEMGSRRKPWLLAAMLCPIERKWIHHGSQRFGDTCEIDIRDTQSSQVVTVPVSPQKYASLSEGEIVTVAFMRGGFGIPYRWRFPKRPNQTLEPTAGRRDAHI
jgi:hypothetical protein